MSGNQVSETDAGRARARTLEVQARLDACMERTVSVLEAHEPKAEAMVEVQRYTRALELTGRLALMVERMVVAPPKPTKSKPTNEDETEMSRVERDDSPENLQRIRDKLMDDFDRIHAVYEQKELDRPTDAGAVARVGQPAAWAA